MNVSDRRHMLRRASDAGREHAVWLAVALACAALAVAGLGTWISLANIEDVKEAEKTARAAEREARTTGIGDLRDSELATCARLQIVRMQSNGQARVIYRTLTVAADSASARRGAGMFERLYRTLADTVTFTPPTDCQRAVNTPRAYRPPAPIRFADCADPPAPDFRGCPRRRG